MKTSEELKKDELEAMRRRMAEQARKLDEGTQRNDSNLHRG